MEVKEKMKITRAMPSNLREDLHKAVYDRTLPHIRRVLHSGVDVNYIKRDGFTPLLRVLRFEDHEEIVALLLQNGADVGASDPDGESAMLMTAWHDESDRCVELLDAAGGDVNVRNLEGATPLHYAAYKQNKVAVRALLAAGARTDLRGWVDLWENRTPVDVAPLEIHKLFLTGSDDWML